MAVLDGASAKTQDGLIIIQVKRLITLEPPEGALRRDTVIIIYTTKQTESQFSIKRQFLSFLGDNYGKNKSRENR